MKRRFRWSRWIGICLSIGIIWSAKAQDRFESAPGPELEAPKQKPRPRVPRPPREAEPASRPPSVAVVPRPIIPTTPEPLPRFGESSLLGHWCAGDIQFTLTPSEWRYELPGGQSAVFRVIGIQALSDTATISFQDQINGTTINEFRQVDNNTIVQIRGRTNTDANWHYYNRSFRRC
jgi:hypothetical protein